VIIITLIIIIIIIIINLDVEQFQELISPFLYTLYLQVVKCNGNNEGF